MFNLFNKEKVVNVYAPFDGDLIDISEVKDDVFAQKMMGDGMAIVTKDKKVLSPINGEVCLIARTYHAVGLQTKQGIQLIVHYGIDTVKYNGEGFKMLAKQNQQISVGDILYEADPKFFLEKNIDLTSPIVVTNSDQFVITYKRELGPIKAGELMFSINVK